MRQNWGESKDGATHALLRYSFAGDAACKVPDLLGPCFVNGLPTGTCYRRYLIYNPHLKKAAITNCEDFTGASVNEGGCTIFVSLSRRSNILPAGM